MKMGCGCCQITLSAACRKRLLTISLGFHALLAVAGIGVIVAGCVIQSIVKGIVEDFDGNYKVAYTAYLITCSVILIVLHGCGFKICLGLTTWKKRRKLATFMSTFVIVWSILCLMYIPATILAHTENNRVYRVLRESYKTSMKKYTNGSSMSEGKSLGVSKTIDRLQSEYKCCGSSDYTDWFTVNWINTAGISVKNSFFKSKLDSDGRYYSDSVPRSCCDFTKINQCVHDRVSTPRNTYDPKEPTLYTQGCEGLVAEGIGKKSFTPLAKTLGILFGLELLAIVIFRLLTTSIMLEVDWNVPNFPTPGYLCCGDNVIPREAIRAKKMGHTMGAGMHGESMEALLGGGDHTTAKVQIKVTKDKWKAAHAQVHNAGQHIHQHNHYHEASYSSSSTEHHHHFMHPNTAHLYHQHVGHHHPHSDYHLYNEEPEYCYENRDIGAWDVADKAVDLAGEHLQWLREKEDKGKGEKDGGRDDGGGGESHERGPNQTKPDKGHPNKQEKNANGQKEKGDKGQKSKGEKCKADNKQQGNGVENQDGKGNHGQPSKNQPTGNSGQPTKGQSGKNGSQQKGPQQNAKAKGPQGKPTTKGKEGPSGGKNKSPASKNKAAGKKTGPSKGTKGKKKSEKVKKAKKNKSAKKKTAGKKKKAAAKKKKSSKSKAKKRSKPGKKSKGGKRRKGGGKKK